MPASSSAALEADTLLSDAGVGAGAAGLAKDREPTSFRGEGGRDTPSGDVGTTSFKVVPGRIR